MTGINELKTCGRVLIDNLKANLSFFAFFEPPRQFKNYQGLLNFIRLSPSFVVLIFNRENGNAPLSQFV